MDKRGLISTNLAEKIALTVTEAPYRVTADIIISTCGQSISAGGVWNLIQRLGERIDEEEHHVVKQRNAGQAEGEKEIPVLFEEMDGMRKKRRQTGVPWWERQCWQGWRKAQSFMKKEKPVCGKSIMRMKSDRGSLMELDKGTVRSEYHLPAGQIPYLPGDTEKDQRQGSTERDTPAV